jgi:hypothetical protein
MKKLILFIIPLVHFTLNCQTIQNGDFESGPHPNFFGQINRADFWDRGCYGSSALYPSLYDCQATPATSGPFAGQILVDPPAGCINPRNNGQTNCRFGSISCLGTFGASQGPGTSIWNELSADLQPNITYEFNAWVARTQFVPPPVGTNVWPVVRRVELVLRATTDGNICDNEIVIPVPVDITFNSCNWMKISTTFQLTPLQALGGYDRIEIRELPRSNYSLENIYIDDVELLGGVTGVDELNPTTSSFVVYPNPVTSDLKIETEIDFEKCIIMDLTGKELLEFSNSKTISLENLASGTYFISILSNGQYHSQRFVKQ